MVGSGSGFSEISGRGFSVVGFATVDEGRGGLGSLGAAFEAVFQKDIGSFCVLAMPDYGCVMGEGQNHMKIDKIRQGGKVPTVCTYR